MSENINFVDDGNSELMKELTQILETGYIRNMTDSEYEENLQPAGSNNLDIRKYLEQKLTGANRLSRKQLEELAARCMCVQSNQNRIVNGLVRKVDERMEDLTALQQQYTDLAIRVDSMEQKIVRTVGTVQNPDKIVAAQDNGDDKSTSADEAKSNGDSEQVAMSEDKPIEETAVAVEETAVAVEETPAIAEKPSSSKTSQKSDEQHFSAQLPNKLAMQASVKPIAPAPQIKIHMLNGEIALTWFQAALEDMSAYEPMLSYQVYCCEEETGSPPRLGTWCKLMEVPAHPLPMTCAVEQCSAGRFHFVVRGVDVRKRVGSFSTPIAVIFDVRTSKP